MIKLYVQYISVEDKPELSIYELGDDWEEAYIESLDLMDSLLDGPEKITTAFMATQEKPYYTPSSKYFILLILLWIAVLLINTPIIRLTLEQNLMA